MLKIGTELENVINNLIQNKFNLQAPMCGTILPVAGTKVNYGSYIVFDKILIITASITATSNIAQYHNIMTLSGGNKQLGGNCYMYSKDGKNCYLSKNYGTVAIYQSGGMTNGQTLEWKGIYALTS